MKAIRIFTILVAVALSVVVFAAKTQETVKKEIPKYTVISVQLDDTLSSTTSKVGETFSSHNTAPSGGFPKNTTFVGVVTSVAKNTSKTPAHIDVKFTKAELPDGKSYAIQGVLSSAEGVKEAGVTGKQSKKSNKTKGIAIGTIAGALVGVPVIGGAAGYAFGAHKPGKTSEVEVKAGTKFYIMLTKPVTIQVPAHKK